MPNAAVEGADAAVRSDSHLHRGGAIRRGVCVVAGQSPSPSSAALTIAGETLDEQVLQHVVETLRFAIERRTVATAHGRTTANDVASLRRSRTGAGRPADVFGG